MIRPRLLVLLVLLLASATDAAAQDAAAPAAARDTIPPAFEVVTRFRVLADSAAAAQSVIERLAATGSIAAELRESARREAELQALLATLLDADFVRAERLSRLRDQALLEDQRLDGVRGRIAERLEQLGSLRARWLQHQRFWRGWRNALRADVDLDLVNDDFAQAAALSADVLEQVAAATSSLMTLQQRADDLRGTTDEIGGIVAGLRAERRQQLLQRDQPVLLSRAHRAQLADVEWREPAGMSVTRLPAYVAFVRTNAALLVFHFLLVIGLALLARRIRRGARGTDAAWSGLLEHPWMLALFASAAFAVQQVALAPPLWDVFLWILLAASGAVLARGLFASPVLRRCVWFIAVAYPLFLLFELLGLPSAAFRFVTAALAAAAFIVFLLAARRRSAAVDVGEEVRRVLPLRLGAAVWAVILAAAVLGYDALARWLTHTLVTSAAVVFVVVLLVAVLRGGLASLLRRETEGRPHLLRRVGLPLMQRLMVMLQVVFIIGAALVLLDVWELAPSPLATWQRIAGFGFSIGAVRISVGRVILAGLVVYIAVLLSWLFRTFVESEFYGRWDLDRGVGHTINTLLHYVLISLGVIFALASLGVQLQNFAIVAGALGIGIGFGLQNIVNNFVSGLILLFERPVRVGDTVIVGGEWGTIRKIGLRSTIMLMLDQSEMIVPNADLISEKVTNWTLSSPIARVIMPVGVAYGSNIARVLEILKESGTAHGEVLHEPPPQALFVGFGESSLDFELRVWVTDIRLRLEVRSAVLAEVEQRLAQESIEIPFPQRDLHLRSVAPDAVDALRR